ncbi:hypothetical protein REPUB_Repub14bG0069200 [Reevesia pubescens]
MENWSKPFVLSPYCKLFSNSLAFNGCCIGWQMNLLRLLPMTLTIWIFGLMTLLDSHDDSLTIWELEDYPNENWHVKQKIFFLKELIPSEGVSQVRSRKEIVMLKLRMFRDIRG